MTTNVRDRLTSTKGQVKGESKLPALSPAEQQEAAARRQILQMVQDGRISAGDAGRLIQQLDAHSAYQKTVTREPTAIGK